MKDNQLILSHCLFTGFLSLLLSLPAFAQDSFIKKNNFFLKAGINYSTPFSTPEDRIGGLGAGAFNEVNNLKAGLAYQVGIFYQSKKKSRIKFIPELNLSTTRFSLDLTTTHWSLLAPSSTLLGEVGDIKLHMVYLKIPLALRVYLSPEQPWYFGGGLSIKSQLFNLSRNAYEEQIYTTLDYDTFQAISHNPPLLSQKQRKPRVKKGALEYFVNFGVAQKLKNGKTVLIDLSFFVALGKVIAHPAIKKTALELNFSYPLF